MSWSLVHDIRKTAIDSGSSSIATFNVTATTIGNVLVMMFQSGVAQTSLSISGGGVGTWLQAVTFGTGLFPAIWYGVVTSATSNTAVTVAANNGNSFPLNITEFSWSGGAATAVTVEAGTAGTNTHNAVGAAISTGVITPSAGRDAIIVCEWTRNGSGTTKTSGPTNGFTELAGATGNATAAYLSVPSTTGSYSAAWVYSNNYATHSALIACLSIGGSVTPVPSGFFSFFE